MNKEEIRKEQGVWIVYDLEANREIQKLLTEKGYAFKFDPNLDIMKKEVKKLKKVIRENLKIKSKFGHFCYMCGTFDDITLHHINKKYGGQIREGEDRKERAIFLFRGEVIPLCKKHHLLIESYKNIEQAKQGERARIFGIIKEIEHCERGYPHVCNKHPEDCEYVIDFEELTQKIKEKGE